MKQGTFLRHPEKDRERPIQNRRRLHARKRDRPNARTVAKTEDTCTTSLVERHAVLNLAGHRREKLNFTQYKNMTQLSIKHRQKCSLECQNCFIRLKESQEGTRPATRCAYQNKSILNSQR